MESCSELALHLVRAWLPDSLLRKNAFKVFWRGGRLVKSLAAWGTSGPGKELAQTSLQDPTCSWTLGDSSFYQPPWLHDLAAEGNLFLQLFEISKMHCLRDLWRFATQAVKTCQRQEICYSCYPCQRSLCQGLLLASTPKHSKSFQTVIRASSLLAVT